MPQIWSLVLAARPLVPGCHRESYVCSQAKAQMFNLCDCWSQDHFCESPTTFTQGYQTPTAAIPSVQNEVLLKRLKLISAERFRIGETLLLIRYASCRPWVKMFELAVGGGPEGE